MTLATTDWLHLAGLAMIPTRRIALALALFTAAWTVPGVCATFRGRRGPLALTQATIFFLAAGSAAFQAFAVFGTPNDATRLGSNITLIVGFVAATALRPSLRRLRKFERVIANVDVALAIVDLAAVDRAAAETMAATARERTAEALIRTAGLIIRG